MAMRVLVTGAWGHIGSFVVRDLLANVPNAEVTALVRASSSPWRVRDLLAHPRLRVLYADRSDAAAMEAALTTARAETVIDCAWEGVVGAHRNDTGQITGNIRSALHLFEAARNAGMIHYVGIGSQAEYGAASIETRIETMLPQPDTAYGVAKVCVQMATRKMAELTGVRYVWLRIFSVYGSQDDARHMLPTLLRTLIRGERPALTPGEQEWDYLHVADAARAVGLAATTETVSGIYNIACGTSVPLRSIIEKARDSVDPALPLGFGDVPYRADQVMYLRASIERFRDATGWTPGITLDEGLRETVQYYREHPTPNDDYKEKP